MNRLLPVGFLALATATMAQAQHAAPTPEIVPPDTLRQHFRGAWPDSLAAAPTPGGTFRLQGQEQPARPFLTLQDQLRTVAGVQVTPYDGSPGSGNVVRIRGAGVATGLAQPLYVIDGLPALNDDLTPGQSLALLPITTRAVGAQNYTRTVAEQGAEVGASPLQLLPPDAIESIEVLTGPAAVARYGPLGTNGVVSIRTRRGRAARPLHVRYSAYAGLQQLRHPYALLPANEYAAVANEAIQRQYGSNVPLPFANTNLGTGTDWQAETYRVAGLQQHQLSLDGGWAGTTYLLGVDYRQQSGILSGSDLTRLGLRLALDQRVGSHLHLHGTATLGQTTQRQPYTQDRSGATRAALIAPPTQGVRNAQGGYSGYTTTTQPLGPTMSFANPLFITDYSYRAPRTRRLLAQLGADYEPLPHLTVRASANFQRTLLHSEDYQPYFFYSTPPQVPSSTQQFATETYQTSQWAAQLAVRYQRQLGRRHSVAAEIDYQYQGAHGVGRNEYFYGDRSNPNNFFVAGSNSLSFDGLRLHRPWARLEYAFDSTLTVEAGLSYAHYRDADRTEYYPSAQVSWQHRAGRLWLGAARTSNLYMGFGLFGPTSLRVFGAPYQSPLYTDQAEAGLLFGPRGGHFSAQVVAYQRTSYHALIFSTVSVPLATNLDAGIVLADEATIRNQGLELTLMATWRRSRLQGTTRLVGSLNRNRLRADNPNYYLNPVYDNQPTGSFYGYQQDGLNANGMLRFRTTTTDGNTYNSKEVIGNGIPAQLVSLSQQLRLGRWSFDAQADGLFGYQLLNYQLNSLDTPTGYTNNATTVRNRWMPNHTDTTIPAAAASNGQPYSNDGEPISSRLLENGANVRLSSLTLTYRLRQTETQDLSVWLGGQNLVVLTGYRGYDPNVSSGGAAPAYAGIDYNAVPVPRTWLLGVKAEF